MSVTKASQWRPATEEGKSFIVSRQAAEAAGPGKGALHDPASGQEDESAPGFGEFDHDQFHAVLGWIAAAPVVDPHPLCSHRDDLRAFRRETGPGARQADAHQRGGSEREPDRRDTGERREKPAGQRIQPGKKERLT
jgi:hypothetical protein